MDPVNVSDFFENISLPLEGDADQKEEFSSRFNQMPSSERAKALALAVRKVDQKQADPKLLDLFQTAIFGDGDSTADFNLLKATMSSPFTTFDPSLLNRLKHKESRKLVLLKLLVEHPTKLTQAVNHLALSSDEKEFLLQEALGTEDFPIHDLFENLGELEPDLRDRIKALALMKYPLFALKLKEALHLGEKEIEDLIQKGAKEWPDELILWLKDEAGNGSLRWLAPAFSSLSSAMKKRFLFQLKSHYRSTEFLECTKKTLEVDKEFLEELLNECQIEDQTIRKNLVMHTLCHFPSLVSKINESYLEGINAYTTINYAYKNQMFACVKEIYSFFKLRFNETHNDKSIDCLMRSLAIGQPPVFQDGDELLERLYNHVIENTPFRYRSSTMNDLLIFFAAVRMNSVNMDHLKIHQNLVFDLFSLRDPKLRQKLLFQIACLVSENSENHSLLQALIKRVGKVFKLSVDQVRDFDRFFNSQRKKLKDADVTKQTLYVLEALLRADSVKGKLVLSIFEKAFTGGTRDALNNLRLLKILLEKDPSPLREDRSIPDAFFQYLQNAYPELIRDSQTKLSETIFCMRNPFALFTLYEDIISAKKSLVDDGGRHRKIIDLTERAFYQAFFRIADGSLKDLRKSNPHLEHIMRHNPNFPLDKWFKGRQELASSDRSARTFEIIRSIQDSLSSQHSELLAEVSSTSYTSLKESLQTLLSQKSTQEVILRAKQKILLKEVLDRSFESRSINELEMFINEAMKLDMDLSEVKAHLKDLKKQTAQFERLCTDNPEDLLLSGSEPKITCQAIGYDVFFSRGLLGLLLNGQSRLLALKKEGAEQMQARAIVRLLVNEENKPILFLEEIYDSGTIPKAKEHLLRFAKEIAAELGVEVYSKCRENDEQKRVVLSCGGLADEYFDALLGMVNTDGDSNSINKAQFYCKPLD